MNDFLLLGHDSPLGAYPAPVVPVGRLREQLVVVYAGKDGPDVVPIPENAKFTEHIEKVTASLREFSYQQQRLFAYGPEQVVAYDISDEKGFFRELLREWSSALENPFMRLGFARATADPELVIRELRTCAANLASSTPELLAKWYEHEFNSAVSAGIDKNDLPLDPDALLKEESSYQPGRDRVARLIKSIGGMKVNAVTSSPFDILFDSIDASGRSIKTAVELKLTERLDEPGVRRLLDNRDAWTERSDLAQVWCIFQGPLNSAAADLARRNNLKLLKVDELDRQARSMSAFEHVFIDTASATIRLSSLNQERPDPREEIVRWYSTAPMARSREQTASELPYKLLEEIGTPSRPICTFDLMGAEQDFPNWEQNPVHRARLDFDAMYARILTRGRPAVPAGAQRFIVVRPRRLTPVGLSRLESYLRHHLELELDATILPWRSSRARAAGVGRLAHRYEELWREFRSSGRESYSLSEANVPMHALWQATLRTAALNSERLATAFRVENEEDLADLRGWIHSLQAKKT